MTAPAPESHGDPEAGTAPDVAGVVVGWRTWQIRDPDRALLRSPLQVSTEWHGGAPLAAACELRGHPAPDPDCTCGIYAARDPADVGGVGFGRVTLLGCVALWGTVVEGERGWRGGVGQPVVLFCGPALRPEIRAELTASYGVPVHVLPQPVALTVERPGIDRAAERVRSAAEEPGARLLDRAARAFVDAAGAPVREPVRAAPPARRRRRFTVGSAVLAVVGASVLLLPPVAAAPVVTTPQVVSPP
ncbi:hypothetical protein [Pseudonocardia endophytica]|uniref:Uncharacterized protein n=1 Tax=Pseudonocardia endophytica TaxID=401976 RepID=A0A4R1HNK3_PSEEN|nr:hypothetical protein [Pseudonocardia endophytica]TCK22683.1 hypothetical protein EV378_6691 [Pseudonocardia endophytica]